jgi:hypothetical protein
LDCLLKNGIGDDYAWFAFSRGNITVKNPNQEIRKKMVDIAVALRAKVQGDNGEIYETEEGMNEKRPWWKVWG